MNSQVFIGAGFSTRKLIVRCLEDAVGDRLKEDVQRNHLRTHNGDGGRVWDFINTGLCECFDGPDCMAGITKRGPWEMVLVYERESKRLFTFMREARFAAIQKDMPRRRRMHYLDMLARHLNSDLLAPGQIGWFDKTFADEDDLKELVGRLLSTLESDGVIIERHVLVLFESRGYQLTSVRAVMVDTNLNIAAEENWTSNIAAADSIIVDTVDDANAPANDPNHGLRLTRKAAARKKDKQLLKQQEDEQVKKN